ncbi:ASCH domain-containing protein [Roseimicrobium sp. ORNL1]|uniref:ASCH domain-containing protein n=1 Tax=Roseimicrobium sp. ORNL1 TaxID=2711231 RepID=UPI0013E1C742|nr:ASCH domain-containing protein [Roseimicrobium sp. ORNL1]QIF02789.1 ASCH domain-containing protein [Roseimicrobium sp. ORNL1]
MSGNVITHPAISVVAPAGDWIRAGKKTLEIRRWQPEELPLRNLVIVQNHIRLGSDGTTEDPAGMAVALVDVESVEAWREDEIEPACASYWEPGWLAWRLVNVRPIEPPLPCPARLRIYSVELPLRGDAFRVITME